MTHLPANNLSELLLRRALSQPDKVALAVKENGQYRRITWCQLADQVHRLSTYLKSRGVGKGSRIGLLSGNRPEWVIADLAAYACGASIVPLYPQSSAQDITYILDHSGTGTVFLSDREQLEKMKEVQKISRLSRKIISFEALPGTENFQDVLGQGKTEVELNEFIKTLGEQAGPDEEASIIYTSGTTGNPKGVMLTHRNIISNVESCCDALPLGEGDRLLSFLPLSHVFERTGGYYFPLSQGAEIYYAESIDTVPDNLKEVRPTVMCSVPRLYEKIYSGIQDKLLKASRIQRMIFFTALDVGRKKYLMMRKKKSFPAELRFLSSIFNLLVYKKIRNQFGGRLRFFISGGAPLAQEIGEFFYSAGILILEGYGLTETSPVLAANRMDRLKFGTVGVPVKGVEIKIAEDGEILARGSNIMKGYFKDFKGTEEVMRDGWFATGDVGRFDGEGYLKITDRKKDIIVNAGGKNISPQKIEKLIISDKYILQVVVIGDKRPYLTALVVPSIDELKVYAQFKNIEAAQHNGLLETEEIRSFIARRIADRMADLSKFEQIQYIKLIPDEFTLERGELTPTLKIRRPVITEKYNKAIDELYKAGSDRIPVTVSNPLE